MSRYKNTKTVRDDDKILKYESTIYQKVPENNTDSLANQFYGDSQLWWFIAHVNNINTMNLEAGLRLRISLDLEKAQSLLDKTI